MQIKTTMSVYHQLINKQQVSERTWRKENPCTMLEGVETGVATTENSMEFPQKIKNETALWHGNATFEYISK